MDVSPHSAMPGEPPPPGIARLTAVERVFIRWCCARQGLPYKLIADRMGIGLCTLHTHRAKVFEKLKVGSRSELMMLAMRCGLDSGPSGSPLSDGSE